MYYSRPLTTNEIKYQRASQRVWNEYVRERHLNTKDFGDNPAQLAEAQGVALANYSNKICALRDRFQIDPTTNRTYVKTDFRKVAGLGLGRNSTEAYA